MAIPFSRPPPRQQQQQQGQPPRAPLPVEQLYFDRDRLNLHGLDFTSRVVLYIMYEAWKLFQELVGPRRRVPEDAER